MKNHEIKIDGMTCVNCSKRVEKALNQDERIKNAKVDFVSKKAKFQTDTSLSEIAKIIKNTGYSAVLGDDFDKQDKKNLKRKTILVISILFTLPFLFSMLGVFKIPHMVALLCATIVQFVCGARFYRQTFYSLKNKSTNMDVLVSLGTTVAYFYSLYNLVYEKGGLYFEGAAFIITFVLIGKFIEDNAVEKSSGSLDELKDIKAQNLTIEKNGQKQEISPEELKVGDIVIIKAGQTIPVDGVIEEGQSEVNQAFITGEPMPVAKNKGDEVLSGSINNEQMIKIKATKTSDENFISQIINIVEEAKESKPKIQKLADKISSILVPSVILISIITFIVWGVLIGDYQTAFVASVSVLVITCPCALGLATPLAVYQATKIGASNHIVFKNINSFESLYKTNIMIFDKTGTITIGVPEVKEIKSFDKNYDSEKLLKISASIQSNSEHILAKATLEKAKDMNLLETKSYKQHAGLGVQAKIDEKTYLLGNKEFLEKNDIKTNENPEGSVFFIAHKEENKLLGYITFEDRVKEDASFIGQKLKKLKIKTAILSGDNKKSVEKTNKEAGFDEIYADKSPFEKNQIIKGLQEKKYKVSMVGDGINDTPALALADVSFAVKSGTNSAIDSSDITIFDNNLKTILKAFLLSKASIKTIRQNLFWAFFYNIVAIPLACFGLLSPAFAGLAMAFSSISVVINSLFLNKRYKKLYIKNS